MVNTRQSGFRGEEAAKKYLIARDYSIIKENFHFGRYGEIDLIVEKDNILVFIEVRSKTSPNTINPLLSLSEKKKTKIRKAAEGYLYINKIVDKMCRLDFIVVDFTKSIDSPSIQHIENAI